MSIQDEVQKDYDRLDKKKKDLTLGCIFTTLILLIIVGVIVDMDKKNQDNLSTYLPPSNESVSIQDSPINIEKKRIADSIQQILVYEQYKIDSVIHLKEAKKFDSLLNAIKSYKLGRVTNISFEGITLRVDVKKNSEYFAEDIYLRFHIEDFPQIREIETWCNGKAETSYGYYTNTVLNEFKSKYESTWDGSCTILEPEIKALMNDPDSYEHKRTWFNLLPNKNIEVICAFSGKNAFGGRVPEKCVAIFDKEGKLLSIE